MSLPLALTALAAGLVLLIKGADWLVDGGSSIARRLHMSDLVIGLTIVSFGTSAPELLVNLVASFRESADIAIGNIVGSNIANTLLILGITALVVPLPIERSTVFKEIPFCLLASVALFIMANDAMVDNYATSELGRGDGLILLGFFIIFLYYTFGIRNGNHKQYTKPEKSLRWAVFLVIVGCLGLAAGGGIAVQGAKAIALSMGITEAIIGVTVVAVGTSLPELVTSVRAAMKGKSNIAVGNIIGSNIFNIFWILGLSSTIKALPFDPFWNVSLGVIVISTIFLYIFCHTGELYRHILFWWQKKKGHLITRWEGGLLLAGYVAYLVYIVGTI